MSEQEQQLAGALRKRFIGRASALMPWPEIQEQPSPEMKALIQAMTEQTAAINRLAQSNEALVQAMAQDGEMSDDLPPAKGLNGKPL